MIMKNQKHSDLYKEYREKVQIYKETIERVVRNKFEMSRLHKWKKEYPEDWKRKAETLSSDRETLWNLKYEIFWLKQKIHKSQRVFDLKLNK